VEHAGGVLRDPAAAVRRMARAPAVGDRMKLAGSICLIGLLLSAQAHASVYYVTIAGLVGEPDY
jgi:hypothetical protein